MAACVLHNMSNDEHDFFDELEQLPELEGVQNEEDSDLDFDCSTAKQCERVRKASRPKAVLSACQFVCDTFCNCLLDTRSFMLDNECMFS